jgi:hypothetical protein
MAQSRRTGFPLEVHGAVGIVLASLHNVLLHAEVFVGNTYTKQAMSRIVKPRVMLDRVRSRLDDAVCREYPTVVHATHIYYPVALQIPSVPPTSLEEVCRGLGAAGATMYVVADLLFAQYPVALGDSALRIAQLLTYHAQELPYVVGPPRRSRHVA